MNKLDNFYRTRADFPEWMTEEEWNEKEFEILNECLVPQIKEQMESLFKGARCPLSVNVQYDEDGNVSVELKRPGKQNGEETETDEREHKVIHRSRSNGFSVYFPDGRVIRKKTAKDTLVSTIRAIGLDKVAAFRGRTFAGFPLVSKTRRVDGNHKWQEKTGGWYVYVNMNSYTKIEVLRKISNDFKLGLRIEADDDLK